MKPETPPLVMHAYLLEVEIDDSRELRLDLPEEIPPGPARIVLLYDDPVSREPGEPNEIQERRNHDVAED